MSKRLSISLRVVLSHLSPLSFSSRFRADNPGPGLEPGSAASSSWPPATVVAAGALAPWPGEDTPACTSLGASFAAPRARRLPGRTLPPDDPSCAACGPACGGDSTCRLIHEPEQLGTTKDRRFFQCEACGLVYNAATSANEVRRAIAIGGQPS